MLNSRISVAMVAAATAVLGLGAAAPAGTASAAPAVFYPLSVTFVSLDRGWALGASRCAGGTCLSLGTTADGGRSWARQAMPTAVTNRADAHVSSGYLAGSGLNIRFANAKDGWIFGTVPLQTAQGITSGAVIWSTDNGARTWQAVAPPSFNPAQGAVLDLEASAGKVYLLLQNGDHVELESSAVGENTWAVVPDLNFGLPAGGASLTGTIVLHGLTGWAVEGNDRGTTGSARMVAGRWEDWAPPCAGVGSTEAFPAAPTVSELYAVCVMGGYGSMPLSAATPRGAVEGSAWLYASTNGGDSFGPVRQLSKDGFLFGQTVTVASPLPGVIFGTEQAPGGGTDNLVASFDGGAQWSTVYRAPNFAYIGFTSPSQGVAIVQQIGGALNKTAMIMTYDGGHQWQQVTF